MRSIYINTVNPDDLFRLMCRAAPAVYSIYYYIVFGIISVNKFSKFSRRMFYVPLLRAFKLVIWMDMRGCHKICTLVCICMRKRQLKYIQLCIRGPITTRVEFESNSTNCYYDAYLKFDESRLLSFNKKCGTQNVAHCVSRFQFHIEN